MASVNKAILVGNVGKEPEIRSTQDGRQIASFSLATGESWKDKATGEKKEKTEWHRIVILNEGLVKIVDQFVKKGSKLYIEGQICTRKWTDKDGAERYVTEVLLKSFRAALVLLDSKEGSARVPEGNYDDQIHHSAPPDSQTMIDDEIPF